MDDLENNRAPLLYCVKLCASFQSHQWIQTGVAVRKRSIRVKIDNFFHRVTWKFEVWPWKTIGHLFYATSSFVHHFIIIGEFKLELQSGNAQFGSKSTIFFSRVTLQFDVWPWKTIGHRFYAILKVLCIISWPLVNSNWSYSPETPNLGQNRRFFLAVWPWNLTYYIEKQ